MAVFGHAGYPVNEECLYYMDKIVVENNVMIGADTIILPGVTIGNNVVIAAGSIVSKDIPSGTVVVEEVPTKISGSFDDLAEKRYRQCQGRPCHLSGEEEIKKIFWR